MEKVMAGVLILFISIWFAGCDFLTGDHQISEPVISDDVNLSALTLSEGTLNPVFSPDITDYTVNVTNSVTEITVTGITSDINASVIYNPVQPVPVSADPNVINVIVTAENGSAKVYKITVLEIGITYFKVVYVSLGGSLTAEEIIIEGSFATEPTVPARDGYTFDGWYTRLAYDTEWDFNSDLVTADTVLFSKWINSESFSEVDRPSLTVYNNDNEIIDIDSIDDVNFYYAIRLPWNYDKVANASREYPIWIKLHSGGADISTPTPPKSSPCLVLSPKIPKNTGNIWTEATLTWFIPIIKQVLSDYPIDTEKIFISGFSQGGAGTYQIANALYENNGQVFASISRAAGGWKGSETLYTLPDLAYGQTSVNLRVGLDDYPNTNGTVDAIQTAYQLIKDSPGNSGATEISFTRTISGHTANVKLIVKNGIERARLTEFPGIGHADYYDSSRFNWFFNQSISN